MAKGGLLPPVRTGKKGNIIPVVITPVLVSGGLLFLLLMLTIFKLSEIGPLADRQSEGGAYSVGHTSSPHSERASTMPQDIALALLHFATTKEVPQQSKEEISATLGVLIERSPCNFLVYGMWHDSLLWATFNYGGRTVFLDESQEWIDRSRLKYPELETYRVEYGTSLEEASNLLSHSKETRASICRPYQSIKNSGCPLAMSQLPHDLLSVQWDVIMIDGPRSYPKFPSFPGRMSPIFTSAVMAHTRTAQGHTDIFLHDVSRPVENEYGQEFLCKSNMVKSVGDLWHFQLHPSNATQFCPASENLLTAV